MAQQINPRVYPKDTLVQNVHSIISIIAKIMNVTKMPTYSTTNKEIVLNWYNEMLFWNKNEHITTMQRIMCVN